MAGWRDLLHAVLRAVLTSVAAGLFLSLILSLHSPSCNSTTDFSSICLPRAQPASLTAQLWQWWVCVGAARAVLGSAHRAILQPLASKTLPWKSSARVFYWNKKKIKGNLTAFFFFFFPPQCAEKWRISGRNFESLAVIWAAFVSEENVRSHFLFPSLPFFCSIT